MVHVETLVVPGYISNIHLVWGESGIGIVVDPGDRAPDMARLARDRGVDVRLIVNTHHHVDHAGDNARLRDLTGARVIAHGLDAPSIAVVDEIAADGDERAVGDLTLRFQHTPGHTPGGLGILVRAASGHGAAIYFSGDTLFTGSVGGTFRRGGSFPDLVSSVSRILELPPETILHPGHGAPSTVAEELSNPFHRAFQNQPEPYGRVRVRHRDADLLVWARDYDGGWKAWVRYRDGDEHTVAGSMVEGAPKRPYP